MRYILLKMELFKSLHKQIPAGLNPIEYNSWFHASADVRWYRE